MMDGEARQRTMETGAADPFVVELRPGPDPWEACRRLAGLPRPLFLDSALAHPTLGRYSFVTADPFAWLRARRGRVSWCDEAEVEADPFAFLAGQLRRCAVEPVPGLPPFQGGAAGL